MPNPNPFAISGAPAELTERINARRARIPAGLMMKADEQGGDDAPPPAADEPLGAAGVRALQQEREARGELEKQLKAMQDQFASLAQAFGVKAEKGAKPDETVADLTKIVGGMQRDLAVERLARKHGITDEDDISALGAVSDEGTRAKLAARLAPQDAGADKPQDASADKDKGQTYPRPKPDASQGPKGAPPKPDPKPGMDRLAAGVTAALEQN